MFKLHCTIVGTKGNDVLRGTAGDDVICGRGGDDVIRGLGGDDVLIGGPGDDILVGGPGNDDIVDGPAQSWVLLHTEAELPRGTMIEWTGRGQCGPPSRGWTATISGRGQQHEMFDYGCTTNRPVPYDFQGRITQPNGDIAVIHVSATAGLELLPNHNRVFRHRSPACEVISGTDTTCAVSIDNSASPVLRLGINTNP